MKNKIGLFSLFAVASFALCSCRFTAPSSEEEQDILKEAGYEVAIIDTNTDDTNSPLFWVTSVEECVYAKKDKDEIYLIYFISTDAASNNYDFIHVNGLTEGQINELIYVGTRQAIKDAKL